LLLLYTRSHYIVMDLETLKGGFHLMLLVKDQKRLQPAVEKYLLTISFP